MDFDRRTLLVAMGGALASVGCSAGKTAPSLTDMSGWYAMKTRFLSPDGRIVDTGNGGISHSEGQGYGMLLAAMAGDAEAFAAMHGWTEATLAREDLALYSWRYDPSQAVPVADTNNASDGDILIAWALMIAGAKWSGKGYLERAAAVRTAIRQNLVVDRGGSLVLLPGLAGFDRPERTTLNPAYYIWPALDAFHAADSAEEWKRLIADGEELLMKARFGALALPTDWIDLLPGGQVEPAQGRPARFGFDAIRVPLYLALGGRTGALSDFAHFWNAYLAQDRPIPAWVDVQTGETAPYPLSAGGMAVVYRTTGKPPALPGTAGEQDYYSTVLGALATLPQMS
ncbi:endoglucanase [Altererythrobacter sp. B11]|uniref:glycosyl hydrolase family 8 n=1 Tax=Altererythrobacter sp. B11 TaxID=2060312 RepID=UPI000DC6F8F4|nr:glycosyl hydrolase family 8 [Altererythrobacter sp. B11]BBC71893.1 endoglucanase [Altererythrobacter sp. B11]